MKRPRWLLVLGCWALVPGLACAAAAAQSRPGSDAHAPAQAAPADNADPAGVRRKLQHSKAELDRLQRDVAAQEARSREADQRLHEQDRALAELRRQLQAVEQGKGASGRDP